jgi:hypothetical protein
MSNDPLPQDLDESRKLLDELFEEVAASEGTLAGGTKLGVGAKALQSLRETNVSFGHPADNLIKLTPELFESVKAELTDIRKAQLGSQFDFYYLTLTVSLQPKHGALFQRLECSLDFGPKGNGEPIVQTIFPTSKWREVLNWGGRMSLGLNADLSWSAGVETPTELAGLDLPANLQANIKNKNEMKSFVVVPEYTFKLGRAEIVATGEGNSRCFWRLENPELQEVQTVQFGVVFKVPKGTSSVELTGLCAAQPEVNWLVAQLRYVFEDISKKLQNLILGDAPGAQRLLIGDHERWILDLPQ